jgi:hypothetical protein
VSSRGHRIEAEARIAPGGAQVAAKPEVVAHRVDFAQLGDEDAGADEGGAYGVWSGAGIRAGITGRIVDLPTGGG